MSALKLKHIAEKQLLTRSWHTFTGAIQDRIFSVYLAKHKQEIVLTILVRGVVILETFATTFRWEKLTVGETISHSNTYPSKTGTAAWQSVTVHRSVTAAVEVLQMEGKQVTSYGVFRKRSYCCFFLSLLFVFHSSSETKPKRYTHITFKSRSVHIQKSQWMVPLFRELNNALLPRTGIFCTFSKVEVFNAFNMRRPI